jgi:DNA-binding NarL/FixJ family response regulator
VLALGEFDGVTTSEAMYRGALGVLTYAASLDDVREAFAAAAEGRVAVGLAALNGLIGVRPRVRGVPAAPEYRLSPREQEILLAVVAGRSTGVIAAELEISVQTVRKHTQNMLGKLGVHSKLQAAAVATREGLV